MNPAAQQKYEVFIRTTPEQVWKALTDGQLTAQYFFGTVVKTTLAPGSAIRYDLPDGTPMVDGVIQESSAPGKLVHTWTARYDPSLAGEVSTVTWLIEKRGDSAKLTAIHELEKAPHTAANVANEGWSMVLSGLKTLLETGKPLVVGQA